MSDDKPADQKPGGEPGVQTPVEAVVGPERSTPLPSLSAKRQQRRSGVRTRRARYLVPATIVAVGGLALSIAVWVSSAITLSATLQPASSTTATSGTFTPVTRIDRRNVEFRYPVSPTGALIGLHADQVSLSDRRVNGVVFIDIPVEIMANLIDKGTGQSILPADLNQLVQYRDLNISVLITTSGQPTTNLSQPLKTLLYEPVSPYIQHPGLYGVMGSFSLPITGLVGSFPQDTYALTFILSITLPDAIEYSANGKTSFGLPLFQEITQDRAMTGYDSIINTQRIPLGTGTYDRTTLVFSHTMSSKLFTLGISLVPLLLAIVLAHLVWADAMSVDTTLLLIFGALFTVLPLRVVLVPAEIGGLTVVDNVLGSELMLLLLVGIAAYVRHLWQGPSQPPREADSVPTQS